MKRWLLLVSLAAPLALGCRERADVGDMPYADKVAVDIPQIEHAIGVKFKTMPKIELRSRQQVREFLLQRLQEPQMKTDLANQEAAYRVLGFIPDTMHLADFMVKVLTEQIIGYYDPKTKVLYVVDGAPDVYTDITIMHELVHALQDQYVNLDSLEHISGDDDRATAAQAVIEGEATYEQLYIMAGGGGNIAVQMPSGWDAMRQVIRENMATQPIFSSAPVAIQEMMLFPYINGADFVRRFKAREGKKLPFEHLPGTTEQLMHDSAYYGNQDVPSEIVLPPMPGVVTQNNLGEFGTRVFIFQQTHLNDQAIRASNGWDGDRYALVKTPQGDGIVWVTVWDQRQDGIEFIDAVDQVIRQRFSRLPRVTGERRRFETGKRVIDVDVRDVGGRPVVLYVDMPVGANTDIVDFSKVKVTPR
jgi:hypothetical protein